MWNELIKRVSQRTGYDEDVVRNVHNNFWHSLRGYLTDPLLTNGRIYLNNFFKFYIPEERVIAIMAKLGNRKKSREYWDNFYKQLLFQIRFGERIKKQTNEQKNSRQEQE